MQTAHKQEAKGKSMGEIGEATNRYLDAFGQSMADGLRGHRWVGDGDGVECRDCGERYGGNDRCPNPGGKR